MIIEFLRGELSRLVPQIKCLKFYFFVKRKFRIIPDNGMAKAQAAPKGPYKW
jgi:hypothetical protein